MKIQATLGELWTQYRALPRRLQWLVVAQIVLATLPAAGFLYDGFGFTVLTVGSALEVSVVLAFWAGMIAEWPDQAVIGIVVAKFYAAICTTIGFRGYSPVHNSPAVEQIASWFYHTASHVAGTLVVALVFLYIRRHVARLELGGQQPPGPEVRMPRGALIALIGMGVLAALLGLGMALTSGDDRWMLSIFLWMLVIYGGPPVAVLSLIALVLSPERFKWPAAIAMVSLAVAAIGLALADQSTTSQSLELADLLPVVFISLPLVLLFATFSVIRGCGYRLVPLAKTDRTDA